MGKSVVSCYLTHSVVYYIMLFSVNISNFV